MAELFNIPVSGLKEGHHTFDFEIDKAFFEMFEESEIEEGVLVAVTEIEKGSSYLDLEIKISGTVRICCDRCLEMFDFPVECTNRLLVKFGDARDDNDPEIITIPRDEYDLDLKQYFYEFIYLALPIQRIHPDDAEGNSTCDPIMLQKLREHLIEEEIKIDPRWDELKKLMNDN
jgi:uncharacterized metal-binding protein YceD (DUF177 family)